MDYNRVVKDLNGLSAKEFLNRLEEKFLVEKADGSPLLLTVPGFLACSWKSQWYRLTAREGTYDTMIPWRLWMYPSCSTIPGTGFRESRTREGTAGSILWEGSGAWENWKNW